MRYDYIKYVLFFVYQLYPTKAVKEKQRQWAHFGPQTLVYCGHWVRA